MSLNFINANINSVNENIQKAYGSIPYNPNKYPILVAVSKIKPKEFIIEAYKYGQRHFGENYIQELFEKSNDPEIKEKCPDIKWHMIGHIQTNKINKLLGVPNLFMIHTVDSVKLATQLDAALQRKTDNEPNKLTVLVQINTSHEAEKSGIDENVAFDLVSTIINNCNHLEFAGLMTIGQYGFDPSSLNPDFLKLVEVRKNICQKLNKNEYELDLSMGMTADYEQAISLGSTIVRVGTAIFGERIKKSADN